ncbi:hypothetical protein CcCBS67573_g06236 [Chytriomyces confervae]|uniref:Uncharacterized protein n=1 Tax=Chytriomyces confervae TaxID=246404 RepID=A0A507F6R1_9FUNG|nr:hypothetical protein CcCBS67573_g06236 [Chytriomyces confervae]
MQQQQQSRHAPSGVPNQPHSLTQQPRSSARASPASTINISPGSSTMDSPSDMDANPFGLAPLESQQVEEKDQFVSQSSRTHTASSVTLNESESKNQPVELPEMMYVTDESGNILTLKDPGTWNLWLRKNCENVHQERIDRSSCPWLVGRNLFEYIDCEKVASFTRHIIFMLGTGQQDAFKYFWYCDTPSQERKMIMNVTSHKAFDDCKLIVWASRIIYEKELAVPESYVNAKTVPAPKESDPKTPSNPKSALGATYKESKDQPSSSLPRTQYSKRILVVADDLPGPVIRTILESSSAVPASIIYDGPLPIIGGRGRSGLQPARACENPSNTHTPTSEEIGPVQLSVQGVVNHLWLTPHLYYNVAHLTDDIQIHNGVCEVCYAEIGWLFFKRGTFENGVRVTETAVKGDGGRVDVAEMRRLEIAEKAVEMERLGMGMSAGGKSEKGGSKKVVDGQGVGKRKGGAKADASTSKDSKRARMIAPKPASTFQQ